MKSPNEQLFPLTSRIKWPSTKWRLLPPLIQSVALTSWQHHVTQEKQQAHVPEIAEFSEECLSFPRDDEEVALPDLAVGRRRLRDD